VIQERTPLERRLDQLGRWLAVAAVAVGVAVAGLGLLQGMPFDQMVQTAIALAVAAVPEGLPVVGTIAMVIGMRRMARRGALIRRLPVVETLGSATVICTDKTGTLTAGEMAVTVLRLREREIAISGTGYAPEGAFSVGGQPIDVLGDAELRRALEVGALANRSEVVFGDGIWHAQGDPTEAALITAARKAGLQPDRLRKEWPEVAEIPFSSERMLMATFHRTPRGLLACVKGAPRRVTELCNSVLTSDGVRRIEPEERQILLALNHELAARGLRVLALATREVAATTEAELHGLTWIGLAGLSDPPAEGVTETIRMFRTAGIRTVMLTGDQRLTAEMVARSIGLLQPGRRVMEARQVAALSPRQLEAAVTEADVFSRVSPEDKLRIVTALQSQGEVVAMLGDGVNDAAALKKADIGVAMGRRGTQLAKEAASVILQDDRFPTVGAAVEEGRIIFDNVRKFVFYLFSCNLAEILVVLGAGVARLPSPLLPLQILWLNLLTDTFPALALAAEPGEPGTMQQPPRDPRAAILSRPMLSATLGYAALISASTLAALLWGLETGANDAGRAGTLAFMTLAFAQILHLGTARRAKPVTMHRHALSNRAALGGVALAAGLQLLSAFLPSLARLLHVVPLTASEWGIVAVCSSVPALVGQLLRVRGRHSA
jgi:Ca2+-transporting ATPase